MCKACQLKYDQMNQKILHADLLLFCNNNILYVFLEEAERITPRFLWTTATAMIGNSSGTTATIWGGDIELLFNKEQSYLGQVFLVQQNGKIGVSIDVLSLNRDGQKMLTTPLQHSLG